MGGNRIIVLSTERRSFEFGPTRCAPPMTDRKRGRLEADGDTAVISSFRPRPLVPGDRNAPVGAIPIVLGFLRGLAGKAPTA